MPKDSGAIDELIDLGKIEEFYKLVGCRDPEHDPTDIKYTVPSRPIPSKPNSLIRKRILSYPVPTSKCDGCCLLKLETKDYYFNAATPVPSEIPGVDSGFIDVRLQKDTQTERHCLAKDYISARQALKKSLEKVFPSTI